MFTCSTFWVEIILPRGLFWGKRGECSLGKKLLGSIQFTRKFPTILIERKWQLALAFALIWCLCTELLDTWHPLWETATRSISSCHPGPPVWQAHGQRSHILIPSASASQQWCPFSCGVHVAVCSSRCDWSAAWCNAFLTFFFSPKSSMTDSKPLTMHFKSQPLPIRSH